MSDPMINTFAMSPTAANSSVISLAGTTASAATAHLGKAGQTLCLAVGGAFDVLLGTSAVGDPGDNQTLPAGVYRFPIKNDEQTHFRVNAHATVKMRWWLDCMV